MIRGIHHTSISTLDLDRLLEFYCGLLGLEVVSDGTWPKGSVEMDTIVGLQDTSARCVFLKAANSFVELFQYESPQPNKDFPAVRPCDPAITHLCFDVDDVMFEYDRLRAAGVEFLSEPQTAFGLKTVYGKDPDGNYVEFLEVLNPKSPIQLDINRQ